jgi:hypothetical protein
MAQSDVAGAAKLDIIEPLAQTKKSIRTKTRIATRLAAMLKSLEGRRIENARIAKREATTDANAPSLKQTTIPYDIV